MIHLSLSELENFNQLDFNRVKVLFNALQFNNKRENNYVISDIEKLKGHLYKVNPQLNHMLITLRNLLKITNPSISRGLKPYFFFGGISFFF